MDGEDVTAITRSEASSEVDPGEHVLSDAQLTAVGWLLADVDAVMPHDDEIDGGTLMWDTEQKVLSDGTLVIKSDDPSYDHDADPLRDWYRLALHGEALCNAPPVALITVPIAGTSCQTNAQCSGTPVASECVEGSCHAIISPHEIESSTGGTVVLSGAKSHDLLPAPDGNCSVQATDQVATWTWQLLSKPSNSSGSITQAPGNTSPTTTLTFDKTGGYLLELKVTDRTGLESPATTFKISVSSPNG
jgi:hypothetical protein